MSRLSFDHLYKAQFGEDRVLWHIFRHRPYGYYIEVGAYDGVTLSNTYFLEQMGWCGLLIEPILPLCEKAANARPRSRIIHAACSKPDSPPTARFTVAQNVPVLSFLQADDDHRQRCIREGAQLIEIDVPVVTLDDVIMHERQNPAVFGSPWIQNKGWAIDVISIDTEGCEMDVLKGINLDRFKPRMLVLENDRPSGSELAPYLEKRGYRQFHRQKINDFYLRIDDAAHDLMLEDLDKLF